MHVVLPDLYISSWITMTSKTVLEDEGITHVLTVMRELDHSKMLESFKRLIIDINDDPDESIIDYFASAIQWIDDALEEGGKVLVHCWAGKSRSATICAAYLMQRFEIGVEEALQRLRNARDVIDPNDGFREQLQVFLDCNYIANTTKAAYRHWLLRKQARLQKDITGKYGKPDTINYASSGVVVQDSSGTPTVDLRCKKCRRVLASSDSFLLHEPQTEGHFKKSSYAQAVAAPRSQADSILPPQCAHFFLEPQDWMQPTLDEGELEGRLECPKCKSKVGGYAWQGLQCSCGKWITPCFSLAKSKVDEVRRVNVHARNGVMKPVVQTNGVKSRV